MRLQFAWGATRLVLLIGTVAIKIARPRPFRAIRRLFNHQMNGVVRARLLLFNEDPFLAGIRYIFAGVIANRNEYRLWRESPQNFMMPTLFSLGGLVNVQRRGESISQKELDIAHPFRTLLVGREEDFVLDVTRADNFCHYEGRVCLVDCGTDQAYVFFSNLPSGAPARIESVY